MLLMQRIKTLFTLPLHQAAKKNNREQIEAILKNGVPINSQNWRGQTALHLAVEQGNLTIIRFLLENNAQININDFFGSTPLHYAAKKNNSRALALLCSFTAAQGINIDAQSPSVAFRTRFRNFLLIPSQIIKGLASLYTFYIVSIYGLHYASWLGLEPYIDGLTLLIGTLTGISSPLLFVLVGLTLFLGLKWLIPKVERIVPLSILFWRSIFFAFLADNLLPANLQFITPWLWVPSTVLISVQFGLVLGHFSAIPRRFFVSILTAGLAGINGAIANWFLQRADTYGGTPLHVAARLNKLENVRYLIEKGAVIDATDLTNKKPLETAFAAGNYAIVQKLMEAGSARAKNNPGQPNPAMPVNNAAQIRTTMDRYYNEQMSQMSLLLKIGPALEEKKQDSEFLEMIGKKSPALTFLGKIWDACPDAARNVVSQLEILGDDQETSKDRICRVFGH